MAESTVWSSTGSFPPVGLLDGQFTDLGSYQGCLKTRIPSRIMMVERLNSSISSGFTNYCILPWRPVVPRRPDFHMIFHEHKALVNKFNASDVFSDLAHNAQYYHYVYLKTGVCVPHECSPLDMERVVGLVGRRLSLMSGPVRCFTRAPPKGVSWPINFDRIENEPVLIEIEAPMNTTQRLASFTLLFFGMLIILASLWQAIDSFASDKREITRSSSQNGPDLDNGDQLQEVDKEIQQQQQLTFEQFIGANDYLGRFKAIAFNYFSFITNAREFMDTSLRKNEINCLHGLRVLTMFWIIVVHTLQYNDWSGFFRSFENVSTLQNIALQPIYNANYCVDHFFFMSGLLAAYSSWYGHLGPKKFSIVKNLFARYLRLTPQVFIVSLLFMILPQIGHGPFWYDLTARASLQCQQNWWINLLHLQAFYKYEQMCNMVSWWISVDMSYYVISVFIIYMVLNQQRGRALCITVLFVICCWLIQVKRHYSGRMTPNNLGVVPQVNEVWTNYVTVFFWSPFTHAYPFFLGLWFGFILANKQGRKFARKWSLRGWLLCCTSLAFASLSSHIWMSGRVELGNQAILTAYNLLCSIIWTSAFAWIVLACHYGTAKWFDDFLSIKPFILLSKASFIIYLSHVLIVRSYFGMQSGLLEVSVFNMTYAFMGNILLSTIFGVLLCIIVEIPALKFQKYIIQRFTENGALPEFSPPSLITKTDSKNNEFDANMSIRMKPGEDISS